MKKFFITAVVLTVIALIAVLVSSSQAPRASAPALDKLVPLSEVDRGSLISIPDVSLPAPRLSLPSLSIADTYLAWQTFQNYLAAAKAHDLEKLRQYSYQISEVCSDPAQEKECFARMDSVVALSANFKQEDFKNIWADNKQIILSTDYVFEQDTSGLPLVGLVRSIIYFVIDETGNPKLLSFNDFDGAFILLDEGVDAMASLARLVQDSDQDSIPDDIENCTGSEISCVKTNPNLRDSDSNGWWDGVEKLFYSR